MKPLCIDRNRGLAVDELKRIVTKKNSHPIDALSLTAPKRTLSPRREIFTAKPSLPRKKIEPLDSGMKERLDRLAVAAEQKRGYEPQAKKEREEQAGTKRRSPRTCVYYDGLWRPAYWGNFRESPSGYEAQLKNSVQAIHDDQDGYEPQADDSVQEIVVASSSLDLMD